MQGSTPSDTAERTTPHFAACLPPHDPQRQTLHQEVHARPAARIALPALITYVAVLNHDVSRADEHAHLCRLPQHSALQLSQLDGHFLRLPCDGFTLKWERHSEYTRYSIVQPLPTEADFGAQTPDLVRPIAPGCAWLKQIPGRTLVAISLAMVFGDLQADDLLLRAQDWLGLGTLLACRMGNNSLGKPHSVWLTHFLIDGHGFERMLVVLPADTKGGRAGRIAQRILELETYRLLALRGLPVARALMPQLGLWESALADITQTMQEPLAQDHKMLNDLIALAANIERATAQCSYRFGATRAYSVVYEQRLNELRERPVSGTQTVGEFMRRRVTPAINTIQAAEDRLEGLSMRVARASALLRTRVDTHTEKQNQVLLEKLTHGQTLQLRLQSTVEGLSIAAISYYVVSLVLYVGKALQAFGLAVHPEMLAGLSIPCVIYVVWRTVQRIHARIRTADRHSVKPRDEQG